VHKGLRQIVVSEKKCTSEEGNAAPGKWWREIEIMPKQLVKSPERRSTAAWAQMIRFVTSWPPRRFEDKSAQSINPFPKQPMHAKEVAATAMTWEKQAAIGGKETIKTDIT